MNINIHDTDINGWTALHYASSKNHVDVVELLADNKANIHAKTTDKNGSMQVMHLTACNGHWAAPKVKPDLVEYLVDYDAHIHAETIEADDRQQSIHISALNGHKNVIEFLLGKGIDVNVTDKRGCTTLHCAAKSGKTDLMAFLVRKGASNCSRDLDNKTPSDYLVESILV